MLVHREASEGILTLAREKIAEGTPRWFVPGSAFLESLA